MNLLNILHFTDPKIFTDENIFRTVSTPEGGHWLKAMLGWRCQCKKIKRQNYSFQCVNIDCVQIGLIVEMMTLKMKKMIMKMKHMNVSQHQI